jgi:NitT/TauT family transport system substrate-binding protein
MRAPRAKTCVMAAVVTVLTMTMAACGSPASTVNTASNLEKTNLLVGEVPSEAVTALYVALQRGLFAAHGLHVTLKPITSTATIVPDLQTGLLDVAAGQVTTFIGAQAEGKGPFHVLASGLVVGPNVNELMTMDNSGITSPADLRGKTIAVNAPVGNGVLLTDAILAAYGIKPSQVKLMIVGFPQMAAALAQHKADAVYVTQPYTTEVEQQLGATVVADLNQGAAQGFMVGGYTVTTAWAAKYPHTAAAFTAAIKQASEIADTNLSADEQAFESFLDINPQVADVMSTGTFPTSVSVAKLQQLADLMFEFHELKKPFNATAMAGTP